MRTLFKTIIDGIREGFGHPVSLIRLLKECPCIRVPLDMPKPCIDAQSVVQWHELGMPHYSYWPSRERGTQQGWAS